MKIVGKPVRYPKKSDIKEIYVRLCIVHYACYSVFNPLNAKLNPICHLLALLGAHRILYVSRIRVNVTG